MINRSDLWRRMREMLNRGPIEIPRYVPHPDRPDLPGEIDAMLLFTAPAPSEDDWVKKAIEGLRDKMSYEEGVLGVDLAQGRSETWEMRYDWLSGKMIYRKVDPADMVRGDEEGEGSPDDGSD